MGSKGKIKTIHYPKRRQKLDASKMVFDIPEPERKSLYDIIQENFEAAGRKTFLHRVIYLGEYHSTLSGRLDDIMWKTISTVNSEYHIEKLTGVLICYKNYFMHIIEGDEDSIHKQIRLFLKIAHEAEILETAKILIEIPHIFQKLTKDWKSFYGMPPKLMAKLVCAEGSAHDKCRQIYLVLRKLYSLINLLNEENLTREMSANLNSDARRSETLFSPMNISSNSLPQSSTPSGFTAVRRSSMSIRNLERQQTPGVKDRFRPYLPEEDVLNFLLRDRNISTLQDYSNSYYFIPHVNLYSAQIWPVPLDLVRFDIFDKPYSVVTELNKLQREKTEVDDLDDMYDVSINEDKDTTEGSKTVSAVSSRRQIPVRT